MHKRKQDEMMERPVALNKTKPTTDGNVGRPHLDRVKRYWLSKTAPGL